MGLRPPRFPLRDLGEGGREGGALPSQALPRRSAGSGPGLKRAGGPQSPTQEEGRAGGWGSRRLHALAGLDPLLCWKQGPLSSLGVETESPSSGSRFPSLPGTAGVMLLGLRSGDCLHDAIKPGLEAQLCGSPAPEPPRPHPRMAPAPADKSTPCGRPLGLACCCGGCPQPPCPPQNQRWAPGLCPRPNCRAPSLSSWASR